MTKKFVVMLMVVFATATVFAGTSKVKTAFVKNSTGDTIALVEQNDDGTYDWSTITIVDKDCVAVKYSEKKINILLKLDKTTSKFVGVWQDFDTKGVLYEIYFEGDRPKGRPYILTK